MIRRISQLAVLCCVGLAVGLTGGCDYSRGRTTAKPGGTYTPGAAPVAGLNKTRRGATAEHDSSNRALILASSIELIKGAALKPGGGNFKMATQQLGQYFEGTARSEYQLDPKTRAYLATQLPEPVIADLENVQWDPRTDARHLEDCMMYSVIAGRVGGTGDDLDRVTRVFNWIMRQIQLVPPGSLGTRQLPHVPARPYDVLLRGMATEAGGVWAERSWLFMSLCRQLGVDVGILTYTKGNTVEPRVGSADASASVGQALASLTKPTKPIIPWLCGAVVHDKVYLFDARVGLPVPGPDGQGVATLDQAMTDPALLERMDLPGQEPFATSRASLLASPTKIGVLIDSSPEYFSPKMRLLQRELAGKDRTILYRDPAEQREHFAQALGDKLGEVTLWQVPLYVRRELFTNPQYVESSMQAMMLLRPELPLIYARIKQLRGDFSQAIEEYVSFRLAENVPLVNQKSKGAKEKAKGKTKEEYVPKEIQQALDAYSTNYLALAQLERNNLEQARDMFVMLLDLLPEPGPSQPYFNMLRWGAHANLGRIYEALGDRRKAIAHYTQHDPTMQHIGNLLRAREIVWLDPMAPPPDPLPPAPTPAPSAPTPPATAATR